MAGNPQQHFQGPPQRQGNMWTRPRAIAFYVGEVALSAMKIICWLVGLCSAGAAAYLAIAAILFFIDLAQEALGL